MGTLKDIYEIIKELKSLVNEYQNEEMSAKIIEIQEAFFDIREELENIKDENRNLKESIKQMEDYSEIEKDLELSPNGFYIRKSEVSQDKHIPYCAACWENSKKLMPLIKESGSSKRCCNCKALYTHVHFNK